ncbi:Uncharacterised protein [Mycolicibacterium flavescens]|nr:Uncharacterised protein [Mycolicibacterium flavescens]
MHGAQATATSRMLADSQPTLLASFELTAPRATLIAACATLLAACIAAIASVAGAIMTKNTANRQKQSEKNKLEIENCRKQLGQLYEPLAIRRLKSRRLYDKLRDEMNVAPVGQQEWRLVDHIVDVKNGTKAAKSAVVEILKINDEIESLMTKNAGLIETSPRHDSFDRFIRHNALLQEAWKQGTNQKPNAREKFPYEIDDDIESDVLSIRQRLNTLLAA